MRYLLLLIVTLLLSGCASMQAPTTPAPGNHKLSWQARQVQLKNIQSWKLNGVIALRTYEAKGGTASLRWDQQNANYTLQLFGPLGAGSVILAGTAHQVTLHTANNQTYTATNPETLLQEKMGWRLPVSNLYYWVRGLPSPDSSPKTWFDENNHLIKLYQDGWQIDYGNYQAADNIDLPGKITLLNPQIRVRMIIKQWNL